MKPSGSALRVHRLLQAQPILSIATASDKLKLSVPTVTASMKHLAKLGITRETTGRNYGRIYAYDKYLIISNFKLPNQKFYLQHFYVRISYGI